MALPLIFFIILLFSFADVQATNARFQSINVNNGLPGNMVRIITQDELGYMWFGTNTGLVKYDGYTFKTYQWDETKLNSIASSFIRALEVDNNNTLWVGSGSGLSRYNRDTDDFSVFSPHKTDDNSQFSNPVNSIQNAKDGFLWLATDEGLALFDTTKEVFRLFLYDPDNPASLPSNNVRKLMRASDGDLWIGTDKGLAHYDQSADTFERIQLTEGEQVFVIAIAESQSGKIWAATFDGLFQYTPSNQTVEKIQLENENKWVISTFVDESDNLWFSQVDNGVFRLDNKGEVLNFRPDKGDAASLTGHTYMSIYNDRSGIIWLGAFRSGISYFNPASLAFGSHSDSINSFSCLNAILFSSVLPLEDNRLLLGTYTAGLIEVDIIQNTCHNHLSNPTDTSSLSSNSTRAIHRDNQGSIWVATVNGLDKFDRDSRTFENFVVGNNKIEIHLISENDGYLVLAGEGELLKLNLSTGEVSTIPAIDKILETTVFYALATDKNGTVWGASQQGLVIIDSQLNEVSQVIVKGLPLLQQRMTALVVDKENTIWLAIDEVGLFNYDPETQALLKVNESLGIVVKEGISGLYQGHDDDLWVTTLGKGLFKIEKNLAKATHYRMVDGLNSEGISEGAFALFPDGKLFFGGASGFNLFDPLKIQTNHTPPIVSLTQLKRFGEKVIPFQDYDGFSLDKHISKLETLNLSHRDSVFGFEFVAIHFSEPTKINYLYRLKGFDDKWTNTNAQNRGVTYNNLDPGEYTFQVKAQTGKGVWSEKNVSLKIIILPAPWLTWWALSFYISMFVLCVLLFIKKRTRVLEQRTHTLKKMVEQRTHELATEKNKVEQLLSRKQEEFANISHEFRTPLTLILGPAQQIESQQVSELVSSKIEVIKRNANRMLRMVDQLLHLETFRVKTITQKSVQDFQTIIQLIAESFGDLASSKGIQLTIQRIDSAYFEFTPDALEKILLNLLSNALKYTPAGKSITISAVRDETQQLVICVKDTGIGIPQDQLTNIFNRFNRVLNENSERITGAGIGLALVKDLVEAHQGKIAVESSLGKGTSINVILPIIGEVDSLQASYQSNQEIIELELSELSSLTPEKQTHEIEKLAMQTHLPSILVIEDNPDMQLYIVESLASNFNCIAENNGEEGLAMAKKQIPDIIISDVMMPKMDGYQVTQALRNDYSTSHIPIILLTALGDRESRLKGWYEKADEYLTKPFDVEELQLRVKSLLEIRALARSRLNVSLFQKPAEQLPQDINLKLERPIQQYDKEKDFLRELDEGLDSLYQDSELKIDAIAAALCMSQRQLLRKLKGILDMTPLEYLRRYRLDKARKLLTQGQSVTRVALDVGFSTHSHFGKSFKSLYGCAPSEYKMESITSTKINPR